LKDITDVETVYRELENRFVKWADNEPDVRIAVVVGSRAREDHPADKWSDLDIIFFSRNIDKYIYTDDWLKNIGEPVMSFLQDTPIPGGTEHRVLFKGGYDVDFVVTTVDGLDELANHPGVPELLHRGIRVLVDKDRLIEEKLESEYILPPLKPPEESQYLNLVNNFLYHCIWTSKKLNRGELYTAKSCLDIYLKSNLLLRLMRWHTLSSKGWDTDVWHGDRFVEEWADPGIITDLENVFAYYDEEDIWRALFATMELFRWVAKETADNLKYSYPEYIDDYVKEIINKLYDERKSIN
jgi:aminoglycoside 6-adenylyltransferase